MMFQFYRIDVAIVVVVAPVVVVDDDDFGVLDGTSLMQL